MKKLIATGAFALALAFGVTNKADAQYFSYSVGVGYPAYTYYPAPVYPVYPAGVSINYYSGSRYSHRHHYGHGYHGGHRYHGHHGHHGHGHRR